MAFATSLNTPSITIRYKGIFDYDKLYQLIADWMKSRKYWFQETKYKHKVPLPTGAEQELRLEGEKEISEYHKEEIKLDIHLWDLTELEVEKDGKTKTLSKARIEIIIKGTVVLDQEKRYQKTKFLQSLRDFMNKYILKEDIFQWTDDLYFRLVKLEEDIKQELDMQLQSREYEHYLGDQ